MIQTLGILLHFRKESGVFFSLQNPVSQRPACLDHNIHFWHSFTRSVPPYLSNSSAAFYHSVVVYHSSNGDVEIHSQGVHGHEAEKHHKQQHETFWNTTTTTAVGKHRPSIPFRTDFGKLSVFSVATTSTVKAKRINLLVNWSTVCSKS